MEDYPKMYAILCTAASEALDMLEAGETERAAAVLKAALLKAEDLYISAASP